MIENPWSRDSAEEDFRRIQRDLRAELDKPRETFIPDENKL